MPSRELANRKEITGVGGWEAGLGVRRMENTRRRAFPFFSINGMKNQALAIKGQLVK